MVRENQALENTAVVCNSGKWQQQFSQANFSSNNNNTNNNTDSGSNKEYDGTFDYGDIDKEYSKSPDNRKVIVVGCADAN